MANEITVTSSTDDEAAIKAALGEKVEAKVPAKKADKAEAEETTEEEAEAEAEEEAEAEAETVDADAEAETEEATPKPKAKQPRDFARERFDRMTWEKNNLLTELEKRDAEIARLRNPKPEAEEETKPKFAKPEPKLDDAESIDKWMSEHATWAAEKARFEVAQEYEERESKRERETTQTRAQREQETVMEAHTVRLDTFREQHPDFDEVAQEAIENRVPITPIMLAHVTQSDLGPALLYHLGKNPDVARKLAKMNAGPCLVAIGKLEARLEAEDETPIAAGEGEEGAKTASAPKRPRPVAEARRDKEPKTTPIKPVSGGAKTNKSPGEMTMAEYKAWRAAGGGKR